MHYTVSNTHIKWLGAISIQLCIFHCCLLACNNSYYVALPDNDDDGAVMLIMGTTYLWILCCLLFCLKYRYTQAYTYIYMYIYTYTIVYNMVTKYQEYECLLNVKVLVEFGVNVMFFLPTGLLKMIFYKYFKYKSCNGLARFWDYLTLWLHVYNLTDWDYSTAIYTRLVSRKMLLCFQNIKQVVFIQDFVCI